MARFDADTIARWRGMAEGWLTMRNDPCTTRDIKEGYRAWAIAHDCGITREAYADRTVVDAHIHTALERIFPNAVFGDAKRY